MDWVSSPEAWIALLTLTVLEIVLGIDNIVFISILASKLPFNQQARVSTIGLALAMITRILLLTVAHMDHAPHGAPLRRFEARVLGPGSDSPVRRNFPDLEEHARDS